MVLAGVLWKKVMSSADPFTRSRRVFTVLAFSKGQLRPERATLKECSTPMTTHESGVEKFLLGNEMGGDEREDVQRDAVDRDERVSPLADIRQRC